MELLAFDRNRLESLRLALGAALDDLDLIRCDDAAAVDVMTVIRAARQTLSELWLPRVQNVLSSNAMTSYQRSSIDVNDSYASAYSTTDDRGWEFRTDPVYGPPVPGARTFDEVLDGIESGALVPMTPPLDANGRAGERYTSLAFAAGKIRAVGTTDTTSNLLKVVDFFSDVSPIGWRENHSLTIYYLTNVLITSGVHVLTAYDRDEGPETFLDLTTEATTSGYMVIDSETSTGELNKRIGPGDHTQAFAIASQSMSSYSGMFFPDYPPEFEPTTHEPRLVNPAQWTFTTSSASMADGWGTWEL